MSLGKGKYPEFMSKKQMATELFWNSLRIQIRIDVPSQKLGAKGIKNIPHDLHIKQLHFSLNVFKLHHVAILVHRCVIF